MRNAARAVLALAAAPLLASCAFLLDFDELQSGPSQAGGAPSTGAGGDSQAGSGLAVGGDACGGCDDSDPCTTDSCVGTGTPACLNEPFIGLAPDGFETILEAELHGRPSLVAGSNFFYLAVFESNLVRGEPESEITLYKLDGDAAELETLGKFSDLIVGGRIASSAGLAIDPTLGGLSLHAFVGVRSGIVTERPRVVHLTYRSGTTTTKVVGTAFDASNFWVPPQALAIGNSVTGAWLQEDGTIAVHEVGGGKTATFGDFTLPATTLALMSTSGDQPALMFTAELAGNALGTYVETGPQSRTKVVECQTSNGSYLSASAIGTQIPGVWLGNVTKVGAAGNEYLTNGSATLVCSNDGCSSKTETCGGQDLSNGVRNVAGATVRFEGDDPGVIYSVLAVPGIQLEEGSQTEAVATLSVTAARSNFSGEVSGASTLVGELLEVSRVATSEAQAFAGPDWPTIAILPSGQLALAWIQPNSDASASELRVQRYQMCLPP